MRATVATFSRTARSRPIRKAGGLAAIRSSVLLLCGAGCQVSQDPRQPLGYAEIANYTTGEATEALDNTGRFRLYEPINPSEITRQQAEALAAAWPQNYGYGFLPRLESEHGGPIGLTELSVCGRTFYVQSAFEPFDEVSKQKHPAHDRVFGPWWLVTLCGSNGQPQVNLAVAAYSTDLSLDKGRFVEPRTGGEWFASEGIPKSVGFNFVEPPEELVVRTGAALGRRTIKPPLLLAPLRQDGFPNHPRWQLDLDGPVTARTPDGKSRKMQKVFSWRGPWQRDHRYQVSRAEQPDVLSFQYPDFSANDGPDSPTRNLVGIARRRPEFPIAFESVTFEWEN